MLTGQVTEENGRFRWTILKDGKPAWSGTRKRQTEAEAEIRAELRFQEKMARRDSRA
jgi:hypothetical protein